jgi:hypothetical protein
MATIIKHKKCLKERILSKSPVELEYIFFCRSVA